jgi:hypothetical protein
VKQAPARLCSAVPIACLAKNFNCREFASYPTSSSCNKSFFCDTSLFSFPERISSTAAFAEHFEPFPLILNYKLLQLHMPVPLTATLKLAWLHVPLQQLNKLYRLENYWPESFLFLGLSLQCVRLIARYSNA